MPFASLEARIQIYGAAFAYFFAFLHKRDLVFGDVSATNTLFALDPKPRIMIIDCDAVRRVGAASVVEQLQTPDWEPPEARDYGRVLHGDIPQTRETDSYKLGLFILRTLTPARGATQETDWRRASGVLIPTGLDLLKQGLSANPSDRPPPGNGFSTLRRRPPNELGGAGRGPAAMG